MLPCFSFLCSSFLPGLLNISNKYIYCWQFLPVSSMISTYFSDSLSRVLTRGFVSSALIETHGSDNGLSWHLYPHPSCSCSCSYKYKYMHMHMRMHMYTYMFMFMFTFTYIFYFHLFVHLDWFVYLDSSTKIYLHETHYMYMCNYMTHYIYIYIHIYIFIFILTFFLQFYMCIFDIFNHFLTISNSYFLFILFFYFFIFYNF